MDLWFNLVYILDEIGQRSIQYEQTAYRELRKMIDDSRSRSGPVIRITGSSILEN
jgi:hypothetical protein